MAWFSSMTTPKCCKPTWYIYTLVRDEVASNAILLSVLVFPRKFFCGQLSRFFWDIEVDQIWCKREHELEIKILLFLGSPCQSRGRSSPAWPRSERRLTSAPRAPPRPSPRRLPHAAPGAATAWALAPPAPGSHGAPPPLLHAQRLSHLGSPPFAGFARAGTSHIWGEYFPHGRPHSPSPLNQIA